MHLPRSLRLLPLVLLVWAPSDTGADLLRAAPHNCRLCGVIRGPLTPPVVLPWLLGSWLAHGTHQVTGRQLRSLRRIVSLDWAFNSSSWAAQRLANMVHWLGQVGEGEGWWGWALIVLALGTMVLANL